MKTILTVLLLAFALMVDAQSKQKFDVIVGVHSGVYGSLYEHGIYRNFGNKYGDKASSENLFGFLIPLKVEVLFDKNHFRPGLSFEYAAGMDLPYEKSGIAQQAVNLLGTFEYAFKIPKSRLSICPAFGIGPAMKIFSGDEQNTDIGYVIQVGVNLEIESPKANFVLKPNFGFNDYAFSSTTTGVKSRLYTLGLNLGARFHLLKAKTEGK